MTAFCLAVSPTLCLLVDAGETKFSAVEVLSSHFGKNLLF